MSSARKITDHNAKQYRTYVVSKIDDSSHRASERIPLLKSRDGSDKGGEHGTLEHSNDDVKNGKRSFVRLISQPFWSTSAEATLEQLSTFHDVVGENL